MKKRLKINGIIMFVASLFIVILPSVFLRHKYPNSLDEFMELFGIAFILLGQIFRASARGYKSEHSKNGSALIQGGPYSLIRNPMYLGILLIGTGIILVLFRWWVLGLSLLIFILRYILLMFKEEKKLLMMFPETTKEYFKSVPRLMPSISMLFRKDIAEYLPLKFTWVKREIGSMLAVLLTTLFVESWGDLRHEGVQVYLQELFFLIMVIILFIWLVIYLHKRAKNLG
jgi:protein-S-isoprenylcysteine O-methyltransferase Ste14